MRKLSVTLLPLLLLIAAACSTPPSRTEVSAAPTVAPQARSSGVPRVAVLMTRQDLKGTPYGEEFMIGLSRSAQEFEGTIVGAEETIAFGEKVRFTVIPTAADVGEIARELSGLGLGEYDLVFGCGFMYADPLVAIHREYPKTRFVAVDGASDADTGDNLTYLLFDVKDAAFLAGVVAATKVKGAPIGFIGGLDLPFIRRDFLGGFREGVQFADSRQGTHTELSIAFADGFDRRQQGVELARRMYAGGVECIYQAAGETGIGVLDAAAQAGKWAIGVDTDQGLEFARNPAGRWILTSTVKRWGTGLYLVCREFLVTGSIPKGVHLVGLREGCVDVAINPYNTPHLLDQLDLIASVREALKRGEIPSAAPQEQTEVWTAGATAAGAKISLAVNDPELSAGVDPSFAATLQKALSTAFHESGRYRVISREQKGRLLEEISASLEAGADVKQQLEVGRLIAAEVIVFAGLSKVGTRYILDTKVVEVQTGIALSASSETFADIDGVFDGVGRVVRDLSGY